jgi:hypothetical protein
MHNINGTVPIKPPWITEFKSFNNFNYSVSFGRSRSTDNEDGDRKR